MSPSLISLSTLELHLWESANILRGPVDAADFKTYIFPALFFKRISDVYDEEVAAALEESEGDADCALFPENHRFQIPEGCHWRDVRAKTTNVGATLQRALREIEKANPHALRHLRRCPVDEQRETLRRTLTRYDRTLFTVAALERAREVRRARSGL